MKKHTTIIFDDANCLCHIHKKKILTAAAENADSYNIRMEKSRFECDCGYKYTQEQLLTPSRPKSHQTNIDVISSLLYTIESAYYA